MDTDIRGLRALVTGAGSGLGAAIARDLAGAGCEVICADVDAAKVEAIACEINGANPFVLDVADPAAIERAFATLEVIGGVDILINNAGVDHTLPIVELSVDQIDHVLDVNLRGPFLMAREALLRWQKRADADADRAGVGGTGDRRGGEIINICSTAAKRAWPNASAYHASKWGLLGLSHAMHVEGREMGVRVTAVVVGGMQTPFILERFPDTPLSNLQDPANVARVVRSVLTMPKATGIPEVMVVPMTETSWP